MRRIRRKPNRPEDPVAALSSPHGPWREAAAGSSIRSRPCELARRRTTSTRDPSQRRAFWRRSAGAFRMVESLLGEPSTSNRVRRRRLHEPLHVAPTAATVASNDAALDAQTSKLMEDRRARPLVCRRRLRAGDSGLRPTDQELRVADTVRLSKLPGTTHGCASPTRSPSLSSERRTTKHRSPANCRRGRSTVSRTWDARSDPTGARHGHWQ